MKNYKTNNLKNANNKFTKKFKDYAGAVLIAGTVALIGLDIGSGQTIDYEVETPQKTSLAEKFQIDYEEEINNSFEVLEVGDIETLPENVNPTLSVSKQDEIEKAKIQKIEFQKELSLTKLFIKNKIMQTPYIKKEKRASKIAEKYTTVIENAFDIFYKDDINKPEKLLSLFKQIEMESNFKITALVDTTKQQNFRKGVGKEYSVGLSQIQIDTLQPIFNNLKYFKNFGETNNKMLNSTIKKFVEARGNRENLEKLLKDPEFNLTCMIALNKINEWRLDNREDYKKDSQLKHMKNIFNEAGFIEEQTSLPTNFSLTDSRLKWTIKMCLHNGQMTIMDNQTGYIEKIAERVIEVHKEFEEFKTLITANNQKNTTTNNLS